MRDFLISVGIVLAVVFIVVMMTIPDNLGNDRAKACTAQGAVAVRDISGKTRCVIEFKPGLLT